MTSLRRLSAVVLCVALAASEAIAADVLSDYQTRYAKAGWDSARIDLVKEIAATGRVEALRALQWCQAMAREAVEDARKEVDKANAKLVPIRDEIDGKNRAWVEEQRKKGLEPDVTKPPRWPEHDDLLAANAQVEKAEKRVIVSRALLDLILESHGELVARLPQDAQRTVREDWTRNRLGSRDWTVRAELYEMLGHTALDWALEMTIGAVASETDPRALGVALDGLAGKDAARVTPSLVARLSDVRWLVRAAAIAALERTPSREGVDALVQRMQKEDGRLRDDCARALRALTGGDLPANPEVWKVFWENNREKWTGRPPAADASKAPHPFADRAPERGADARRTGFFGLEIQSKRVVFVIDVSGSMTWEMGGAGPDAKTSRAELAKKELERAVAGLEDGTLFDIVFYAAGVRVWKPEMQKADARTRREARDYVAAAEVMGATNTYDALEAAFSLGDMGKGRRREADPTGDARVDTIVLLSDGRPTQGRTTDPDAIRMAVREWNRARRITVHTVAFGVGVSADRGREGADPAFMKGLADDTGGTYIEK